MKSVYISELILIKRVPLKNVMPRIEMCFYVNMQIVKPRFKKKWGYMAFGLSVIPCVISSLHMSFRHNSVTAQYLENKLIKVHQMSCMR